MSERVPAYCRQKESGRPDRAFCRIDGKKINLGRWGSSESKAKYSRLIAGEDLEPVGKPVIIEELLAQYLDHIDAFYDRDSRTWQKHRLAMRMLREHFADLPIKDFRGPQLKELQRTYADRGLERKYIGKLIERIKQLFRWGLSEDLVPADSFASIDAVSGLVAGKTLAYDSSPVEPVSDADVEATIPHLPANMAVYLRIQRLVGARPSELLELRKMDLDRSGDVWTWKMSKHKNSGKGKDRFLLFGPEAQRLLLPMLVCPDEQKLFDFDYKQYWYRIDKAADKAGVEHWAPNQLRHAAGTQAANELSREHAQGMLGHSSISMTQRYTATANAKAIEAAKKFG
jgi:site-specific recombinase XerD